ncbi:MAG TPA: M20 family peptidase [Thermoanaerobaculia bacterium]|nr:M20 family peptidase [Thermoanaerobaculia bacterium]
MKRIFAFLGLALLLLVIVVCIRASLLRSRQVQAQPVTDLAVDAHAAASRLAGALRFATVSHEDGAQVEAQAFLGLHRYLEQSFPKVHATLTREVVANYSLLYTWPGKDPKLAPILLMSHQDVVPVEPGTEKDWTHPPFSGDVADGFVWGRGALDDKSGVTAILEAVELLLGKGFQPQRTLLLAFGHDEEVGGPHGAAALATLLAQRGVHPEMILDEGGAIVEGVVPDLDRPAAMIGTAEKGSMSVELTAEEAGGHSSMPPPHTAIGRLAEAIEKLEDHPMPARIDGATRRSFEFLAPELPFSQRLVLANLWLFAPVAKSVFAADPAGNARIRTTTAATIFQAGVKENVLPHQARAVVNFRILPGDTGASVLQHVRDTVGPAIHAERKGRFSSEPSRESDADSPAFHLLQKTLVQTVPGVIVAPNLLSGGTDTRHYEALSPNVYRFLPVRIKGEDLKRLHGTNERVGVESYGEAVRFFVQLIRNGTGG